MRSPTHPAAENIHHLGQAIELIRQLDDAVFTNELGGPFRGGVGSQFRHYLDFYGCFLAGLAAGKVDYTTRERDPRLEQERDRAVQRIREIIAALEELEPGALESEIRVRSEPTRTAEEREGWCRSTVHRELQFLASHTVHHHALILSLLAREEFAFGPELAAFGVAPSTAMHWDTTQGVVDSTRPSEP
jgi:uncharacterized damage-inducible protein DinB